MNANTQKYALAVLRVLLIALRRQHRLTMHIHEIQTEVFKHLRVTKEKHKRAGRNYIHAALQAMETNKIVNGIDDELDPTGQIRRADRKQIFSVTRKATSWFDHQYGDDLNKAVSDKALMAAFVHFNLVPRAEEPTQREEEETALAEVRERGAQTETAPWGEQTTEHLPLFSPQKDTNNMADTAPHDKMLDELVDTIRYHRWHNRHTPAALLAALYAAGATHKTRGVTAGQINWEPHKLRDAADVLANFGLITWASFVQPNSRRRNYSKPTRRLPYLTTRGKEVAERGGFVTNTLPVAANAQRPANMLKNSKRNTTTTSAPPASDLIEITTDTGEKHVISRGLLDVIMVKHAHTAQPASQPPPTTLSIEQTIAFLVPEVLATLCTKIAGLKTANVDEGVDAEEINKKGLYHALNVVCEVVQGLHGYLRMHLNNDEISGETPFNSEPLKEYADWFALSMEELAAGRSRDIPLMTLEPETRKLKILRLQKENALRRVRWTAEEPAQPAQ